MSVTRPKLFEVETKHTVYITYTVSADTPRDAVAALGNINLFQQFGEDLAGPCEFTMQENDIEVAAIEVCGDPEGTQGCREYIVRTVPSVWNQAPTVHAIIE